MLEWNVHIGMNGRKVETSKEIMKHIKPYVPANTLQPIYRALIQTYFDHGSLLLGVCNKQLKHKLQKLQNQAARIITGASFDTRSADVLRFSAHGDLEIRRCTIKVMNDYTGPNLKESLTLVKL